MKLKIKTGDSVQVIAGSMKGTKGSVMAVDSSKMRIKVQGVNIQTHFDKKEGILKSEGFISYSNVKLLEKATKAAQKSAKGKASKSK